MLHASWVCNACTTVDLATSGREAVETCHWLRQSAPRTYTVVADRYTLDRPWANAVRIQPRNIGDGGVTVRSMGS